MLKALLDQLGKSITKKRTVLQNDLFVARCLFIGLFFLDRAFFVSVEILVDPHAKQDGSILHQCLKNRKLHSCMARNVIPKQKLFKESSSFLRIDECDWVHTIIYIYIYIQGLMLQLLFSVPPASVAIETRTAQPQLY